MRILVVAMSSLDTDMCLKELLATYQQHRQAPKSPWSLEKCLTDIDTRKASIEGLAQGVVDFLPEYKDKNKQDLFVSLLGVFEEAKKVLVTEQGGIST
jgi:hypothetical protein